MESMYIVLAGIIMLVIVGIIVYYSTSYSSTTSQNEQDVRVKIRVKNMGTKDQQFYNQNQY
uniref:Uncharacterized protein n=1 Tax=viral metagenome TaxID=1070528 RepID=A0A6C0H728_9ZZZZ